jgi:hypothetical protein
MMREGLCGSHYKHFDHEETRKNVFAYIKNLDTLMREKNIKNLVLLDRSIRPMAHALMQYRRLKGITDHPDIYFINPKGAKKIE